VIRNRDHGHLLAMRSFDLHAVFDAHHTLLDLAQLVAMGIFEDQGLAHAQSLAIHLVNFLPVLILDPEIIADRHHLLAHLVAVATSTARPPELAVILAFIAPFFSSASHHPLFSSSGDRLLKLAK
jgi:hypothetical protein